MILPVVYVLTTTRCYAGPGESFDVATVIVIDPTKENAAYQSDLMKLSDGYWLIQAPDGQQCWVVAQYDLSKVFGGVIPTLTPIPTATLATPTAAPPAVESVYLKKKKCSINTSEVPSTHYFVEITFILEWTDVVGEDGYRVYRDGNLVGELAANDTVFTDTFDLKKPGRTSTYYVVAFNVLGESRSPQFSFANPC